MRSLFLIISLLLSPLGWAATYYVAKTGNNLNSGGEAAPFQTLAAAATAAHAGDTCYIDEGTYRETLRPTNSGTSGHPIVFMALPGKKVVISAMEVLSNWSLDAGSVYKTPVDWSLGQQNFVTHQNTTCDLARWPNNTDGDPFTPDAMINTGGTNSSVITNAYLEYSPGIPNYNWNQGGSLYFYCTAAGWTSWRATIKSSSSTRVTFNLPSSWIGSAHPPADRGEFYLQGIREVLDYDNEWYLDATNHLIYLQLPGGGMPADSAVEMRRREYTIDLSNREYIEIRNLGVFGGSIDLTGASNYNTLYGLSSFHGNHTLGIVDNFVCNSQSINVQGSHNTIEKCEVAYGTGSGIWLAGSYNRIENCNIHDFDFIGDYDAPLMIRNGNHSTVRNNTIYRGGRDCVQWFNTDSEFAYNKVSQSNLIAQDCALFYTVGGPFNGNIHHNFFYNASARGSFYKAAGIYLDNDADGFDVHHNVVYNTEWSSIQINLNAKNLNLYNNTLWQGSKAMDAWHQNGTSFTNVKVWNNLADNNNWESQADKQNNLMATESPFVELEALNFMLAASTTPIDYGREISGITDGYMGSAPDAGAYEFGGESWTPGIDWDPTVGPAQLGCYGLPGDACDTTTHITGVAAEPTPEWVRLFPNPATDALQLVLPESFGQTALRVYTPAGVLLISQTACSCHETLDISRLSDGFYLVQIQNEKQMSCRRFLKAGR